MERGHTNSGTSSGAEEFLLTAAEFRGALARERELSDRSGEPFALLVLELRGLAHAHVAAAIGAISRRVRATDVLGWIDEHRLGLLLRYASVEDALRVANDVRARAGAGPGELSCTVHGHPPLVRGTTRAAQPSEALSNHVTL